jgi:CheY-like chemotaxis protein
MAVDLLELSRSVPTSLVSTLRQSAQRGSALVQQVLTFARRADHRSEPVQLRHLIAEIAQFAQLTFPPSINVRVAVPADLWLVQADATQMHQVLMNLCVNARDAMPAGGDLTIAARNEDAGKRVIVSVQDTGTGIAPDIHDKIFDPFFTTKEPGKGTGLGLAMVREIVHKLGGSVRVASEIGTGSCFEVEIPALAESAAPPAATPQPAWPTGNGELVLVVDDEAGLRRMVAMMLEATGYRVMTAQNGAEALALYEQHSYGISVVLTDITMPHLDGVTMIDALRKINPQIRVIVASGTPTNLPDVHATLRRPYSAPMLLVAIRNALAANPANGGG